MRTIRTAFKLTLSLSFLLCQCAPPLSAAEDVYEKMANDFAKYSVTHKIKNVTVIDFLRKARTSLEESEYISEKLLSCLVASGKVNLLERSQLAKILEERRLSTSGVAGGAVDSGKKIDSSNAIIAGTVFGTKRRLKIIAKMIDPLTGAVLHTVEAETERQFEMVPERQDPDNKVPDLRAKASASGEGEIRPQPPDFTGARVSPDTDPCDVRKVRLASMQSATLEARAKYWSLRLRDPDFNMKNITRNPGGALASTERKKFYDILRAIHTAPEPPEITVSETKAVLSVIQEEERIAADCELH